MLITKKCIHVYSRKRVYWTCGIQLLLGVVIRSVGAYVAYSGVLVLLGWFLLWMVPMLPFLMIPLEEREKMPLRAKARDIITSNRRMPLAAGTAVVAMALIVGGIALFSSGEKGTNENEHVAIGANLPDAYVPGQPDISDDKLSGEDGREAGSKGSSRECDQCLGDRKCRYCLTDGSGECDECWGSGEIDCTCFAGDCTACLGDGKVVVGSKTISCTGCGGSGKHKNCGGTGKLDCYHCDGKGFCFACKGTGICPICD